MKFKVGDKVKIKEDLSFGHYSTVYFSTPMKGYRGKEAKITYVSPYDGTFNLDIDNGNWWWSEDMLEPFISKFTKSDLEDGDLIKSLQLPTLDLSSLTEGNYSVKYEVTDSDNNTVIAERKIIVLSN